MTRELLTVVTLTLALAASSSGSECDQTSVGLVPVNDLGQGLYLGLFRGGLYPDGLDVPPPEHAAEGMIRAATLQPLSAAGNPDPRGAIVLLSIGMSNTTQEFCSQSGDEPCDAWTFMGQAAAHPLVNRTALRIVNGAKGGQAAATWDSPQDLNYDRVRDQVLAPRRLTEAQVRAARVKVADAGPAQSLPSPQADAWLLLGHMGNIARALKVRYPNLELAFFSSRIYAGYASTALNPEPYAYESGFSVKWLIEAQIEQMAVGTPDPVAGNLDYGTVVPWLGWGPYPWADGLIPRSDGLTWACSDMAADGTHPATPGEEKVGSMLLSFFLGSPFTSPWFRDAPAGDVNGDGTVGVMDLLALLAAWGPCPGPCPPSCAADLNGNCNVGIGDLLIVLAGWE